MENDLAESEFQRKVAEVDRHYAEHTAQRLSDALERYVNFDECSDPIAGEGCGDCDWCIGTKALERELEIY